MASACSASVGVRVDVERSGAGSVTVDVTVPRSTAARLEDLAVGLPVSDLRQAGWEVEGPRPGPDGSTLVSASHLFSNLSQLPVLVGDIAGSGPLASRPFRLEVTEAKGLLEDRFTATGRVDFDCSLSCFNDPRLQADIGYPLGVPPAQLARLLGPSPGHELSFRFEVALPGRASSTDAASDKGGVLEWSPALGSSTAVDATSESVNVAFVHRLVIAVGAGALVVLATALLLVARGRRRRVTVTGDG